MALRPQGEARGEPNASGTGALVLEAIQAFVADPPAGEVFRLIAESIPAPNSQVPVLKFENGMLISVEAIGPSR
jgi:hypothetical protein